MFLSCLRSRGARAAIVLSLLAASVLDVSPVSAATPGFQLPFACGEVWRGTTYKGHGEGDNAVDFSFAAGPNAGRAVLSSAAGTVVETSRWRENGEIVIRHADGWATVYAHLDPAYPPPAGHVGQGTRLGYIDPTPNPKYVVPDGFAHLHYEQVQWGVQRDAVINGARFTYGTWWRSANCPPKPAPKPTVPGPALFYGTEDGRASVYRWTGPSPMEPLRGNGSSGPFEVDNVADRMVGGDFNGNGIDDVLVVYDTGEGFAFYAWEGGTGGGAARFSVDAFDLAAVGGRVVAGDWNGDGLDDVAMGVNTGDGRVLIRRYLSQKGGTFVELPTEPSGHFDVNRVGNRMVAGSFDNRGGDDVAMAFQTPEGRMNIYVFRSGQSNVSVGPGDVAGIWYEGQQPYDLGQVSGRMVAGQMAGSAHADIAFGRANPDGTVTTQRLETAPTGGVRAEAASTSGPMDHARIGNRMAAGDITGDGLTDVVYGYQAPDGTLDFLAWPAGAGKGFVAWNGTGSFSLDRVAGRMTIGDWH